MAEDWQSGESGSSSIATPATVVAAAGILVSAAMLPIRSLGLDVLGYFVGCLVPFTAVALARRSDSRLLGAEGIVAPAWRRSAFPVIIALGFLISFTHAFFLAMEIAKRVEL